jgi:hypothetical protein
MLLAAVGLISGVIGIYAYLFPPKPDTSTHLVEGQRTRLLVSPTSNPLSGRHFVRADEIVLDGVLLEPPDGSVYLCNILKMVHGAKIRARQFAIISTRLEGGVIDASGRDGAGGRRSDVDVPPEPGEGGGGVLIATASLTNFVVSVKGGDGGIGADGRPRPNASDGRNGRDGDCGGFGAYKGATPGEDGSAGFPAEDGQAGGNGGNGGTLVLITVVPIGPGVGMFGGGAGGIGGRIGPPGKGGLGGKGGAGCTGLGGSQPTQPNGNPGVDGAFGRNGNAGRRGADGNVTSRVMKFAEVKKIVRAHDGDPEAVVAALKDLAAKP